MATLCERTATIPPSQSDATRALSSLELGRCPAHTRPLPFPFPFPLSSLFCLRLGKGRGRGSGLKSREENRRAKGDWVPHRGVLACIRQEGRGARIRDLQYVPLRAEVCLRAAHTVHVPTGPSAERVCRALPRLRTHRCKLQTHRSMDQLGEAGRGSVSA